MSVLNELEPSFTNSIRDIQRPASVNVLSLHSPAMEVFTDFCRQQPLMVEQNTTVEVAHEMMRRTHTELFLVIDAQEAFRGILSQDDLESEKAMQEIGQSRMRHKDLTVERVMTPRNRLRAIDFREFQLANIGDVLARLRENGEQHMLVAETKKPSIRGVVSVDGIARRMHAPVVFSERALSFSDICRTIAR